MAVINISRPNAVSPVGSTGQVPLNSYTVSSHVNDGDFVTLTGGTIATATTNPATVTGIATHDSDAYYAGTTGATQPRLRDVFGHSQLNSPLVPNSPLQTLVASVRGQLIEINLSATTGFITGGTQQVNIGSPVGLSIDPATGFFVADPTVTNLIAIISSVVKGPGFTSGYQSGGDINGAGNTGDRVQIRINAASIVGG